MLAHCNTTYNVCLSLLLLAIQCKNCNTTKIQLLSLLLLAINSSHIAMASCLHPCDTKKKYQCHCFLGYNKKYAFASNGIKNPNCGVKAKPQSNNFACGRHFQPHFFQVKDPKQSQSRRKLKGKKAGEVTLAV